MVKQIHGTIPETKDSYLLTGDMLVVVNDPFSARNF